MIVKLWIGGSAQMVIPPAVLQVFAGRLGPGRWERALHRVILSARVRYWFQEWALATRHPRAMFDPRWISHVTVTVIEGETHARP